MVNKKKCKYCEYDICGLHLSARLGWGVLYFLLLWLPVAAMAWQYHGLDLWPF